MKMCRVSSSSENFSVARGRGPPPGRAGPGGGGEVGGGRGWLSLQNVCADLTFRIFAFLGEHVKAVRYSDFLGSQGRNLDSVPSDFCERASAYVNRALLGPFWSLARVLHRARAPLSRLKGVRVRRGLWADFILCFSATRSWLRQRNVERV